ncbi:hypothetical protein [uncultured Bacteroides sp.]|uniref:hypothetical protein n=1 Tax=uncultured Bacteroides sp. TaxID=162156 RepID=UPI00260EEB58|nr:hypothetical protein [uncultured Bacteroides sp.]
MDSLDLCNSIRMEFEGVIENKIPLDVFPAKLQDMVLALARQENYSIEYTMASLIAAASTAIGNAVNIRIRGGWVSSPILQQKEKEEDEKLQAVLQYTRNTFRLFDFSEEEIFQICECVRYFVTNRQALSVNIHIKRRTAVTQISLKNFAWNIAFQYNISRDVTAQFVMQTFHEWFANSTIDTIRKNLRTTTGRYKIKIDEHIASITRHA